MNIKSRKELFKIKLFSVAIMEDCEYEDILVVANNKEEAEKKVSNMDWSCLMFCLATEVKEVDGYKIKLKKGRFRRKKVNR